MNPHLFPNNYHDIHRKANYNKKKIFCRHSNKCIAHIKQPLCKYSSTKFKTTNIALITNIKKTNNKSGSNWRHWANCLGKRTWKLWL